MAVHPEFPGLEVEVCVKGQPLHEYDDDKIPEPKTTTKYIEASSNNAFTVVATFAPPFPTRHGVRARLSIDGVLMDKWYLLQDELFKDSIQMHHHYSYPGGECVKQQFIFAKLNIVEESDQSAPDIAALEQVLNNKGSITLSLEFIDGFLEPGESCERSNDSNRERLVTLEDVPEKALKGKALSHQAVLSKPQKHRLTSSACPAMVYNYVDEEPFATFHFKYRSLTSLKALHLLSVREHAPVPLEERPEEDLSAAELRELLRRVRRQKSESASIKAEHEATTGVKRERTIDDDDEVTYVETRQRKRPHVEREIIVLD